MVAIQKSVNLFFDTDFFRQIYGGFRSLFFDFVKEKPAA